MELGKETILALVMKNTFKQSLLEGVFLAFLCTISVCIPNELTCIAVDNG
jgi:hypothetical protein